MHYEKFLRPSDPEGHKVWVLIEYVSWCCEAEGNLAGTISGKLAAVQYFHRLEAGVELPTTAPVLKSALKGIARGHVAAGTPRQVRLPVSWGMLLEGEGLIPSWGAGGKEMWLCLCLSYFLIARSDEVFASDSGVVHPAHCLTRGDVAFFAGDAQLAYALWPTAGKIEVRVRGHKGDQDMTGSVRVRTRDEITGPRSGYRAGGGAVTLMVELMSCHRSLPASAPLSSYSCGKSVRVLRYGHALRAFRDLVANAGRRPERFALHSLRIGGATTLAAGGDVPEVAIQREGGWRSDVFKIYTRNNMADSRLVSRKLGDASRGVERQPGEGTKFSLV